MELVSWKEGVEPLESLSVNLDCVSIGLGNGLVPSENKP